MFQLGTTSAYVEGMNKTNKQTIRIEQANGDSFQKRVNAICRYFAGLQDIPEAEKQNMVRESVIRSLDHCEIYVTNQ